MMTVGHLHIRKVLIVLRLIVKRPMTGYVVLDATGPETIVKAIAERYRQMRGYSVTVSYS